MRVRADMQGDGNLVVYKVFSSTNKVPIWYTATSNPGSYATLQGDQNLVVYKGTQAQWSSH